MALPMMISMIVQALYSVVDRIFVARLSEDALTAVTLAFPIQSLMVAFGAGFGVGVNALLSKSLGEGDKERANRTAVHGLVLFVGLYLVFLLVGIFLAEPFMNSQAAGNAAVAADGSAYLSIVTVFSMGIFGQFIFERLLQSTGRTFYTMITQTVGAVLNIILDPILIFGLLGLPRMGAAGAAAATVLGQIIAAVLALIFNLTKNKEISLSFRGFHLHLKLLGEILSIGVPSVIMQSIGSVMNFGLNAILSAFPSGVAVFGICFQLLSFVFMPVFGMTNAMIPIISYNYGAQKKERLLQTVKLGVGLAVAIMLVGTIVAQLMPTTLLAMFDASEHMVSIGVPALRIVSLHFPIAAVVMVLSAVFQALGKGIYSMLVSFCRQLIILLPLAYLFAQIGGLQFMWWAFMVSEICSLVICLFFFQRANKRIINFENAR